jgi:anti-repressor protein
MTDRSVVIAGVEVTTDAEGRFNLNALHKAHLALNPGLHPNTKQPADWLKLESAKELIQAVSNSEDSHRLEAVVSKSGRYGGTFAHELIAVEYAGWISPSFRIKVNQTFIDFRKGLVQTAQPAFVIPQTLHDALRLAADLAETNAKQAVQIAVMEPKADFHDRVTQSQDLLTIREAAKLLRTGERRLFGFLRREGMLMASNLPIQTFMDRGLFRLVETPWTDQFGRARISVKTCLTQKGLVYVQGLQDRLAMYQEGAA